MTIQNGESIKAVQEINMPDSVVALNVYYFEADFQTAQDEQDVIDAAETWMEGLYGTLVAMISDLCSLGTLSLYTYDAILDQWDLEGTGSPTVTFTNTSEMLPHGVACMVRAYTTRARTIGRKYIPGIGEYESTDGAWTSAFLANAVSFGNAWDNNASIDANNRLVPAVWSKVQKDVYQLNGTEVVLADPCYQRRRRPGVGT